MSKIRILQILTFPVEFHITMDFLLLNKEIRTREPRQIVNFIFGDNGGIVDSKIDEITFKEEISKAGNRQILFIDVIGQSQVGKSSTIKALTRNNGHVVGDGISEKTIGVTIDGPYEGEDLITGYGFRPK